MDDIMARLAETKKLIRHVRTPGGARYYGQPIGSVIIADGIGGSRRRKRSRSSSQNAPTASESDENTIDVSLVENETRKPSMDPVATAASTDAEPYDLADTTETVKRPHESWRSRKVPYFENDPPMAKRLDRDYLNNATKEQALEDLTQLGVRLNLTPEFANDREFMTSLAEVSRVFEEMWPGFLYRHGNIYGANLGGALGVNVSIDAWNTDDDRYITATDSRDHTQGTLGGYHRSFTGVNPYANVYSFVSDRLGSPMMSTTFGGPTMSQSYTSFDPALLEGTSAEVSPRLYPISNLPWASITDWRDQEDLSQKTKSIVYAMTHEFGHALNNTVSGSISFDMDSFRDEGGKQRQWYAEYYATAMLKMYDDMGVIERTDKPIDMSELSSMTDHYYEVIQPNEMFTKESIDAILEKLDELNDAPDADAKLSAFYDEFFKSTPVSADLEAVIRGGGMNIEAEDIYDWFEGKSIEAPTGFQLEAFSTSTKNTPVSPSGGGQYFSLLASQGYIEPGSFDYDKWLKLVSMYGSTRVVEFEAESFASYMLNERTTEAAYRWGNTVHEMMLWWIQDDPTTEFEIDEADEEAWQ